MKKFILIIILLILSGAVYYFLSVLDAFSPEYGSYETKTDARGSVEVAVTPTFNNNGLEFDVEINTHTVALTGDMLQMAELNLETDNIFRPISWSGGELSGGHHAEGVLKFEITKNPPEKFILTIKNLGGVTERKFEW